MVRRPRNARTGGQEPPPAFCVLMKMGGQAMALRERILSSVRRRLGPEGLPLRLAFWDGTRFDLGPSPAVTMTFTRPAVLRALLRGDVDRLAESYVEGALLVDGRLQDILALGISLAERIGRNPWLRRLGAILGKRPFRHTRQADAQAIRYHYDVSNEFYALWL